MSSTALPDHVDRLSLLAKSIRANAAAIAPNTSNPFTEAVLHTPLGDLIRDIDPAEMGLFTLVAPPKPVVSENDAPPPSDGELARVEFHGATPLKKPPAPKPGRPEGQRTGEHEPEVYARAAVKYLNRYQSIRPMPRASERAERIMGQLSEVRDNMRKLSEHLKEHTNSDSPGAPVAPESIIQEEERRIRAARAQIAELKKRKQALLAEKTAAAPRPPRHKPRPRPDTPPPGPDEQEVTFWNTPGAAARTLHFTGDSLLDEEALVADMSNLSFSSPVASRRGGAMGKLPKSPLEDEDTEDEAAADETVQAVDEVSLLADETPDDDDSDPTVRLRLPSPRSVPLPAEDTTQPPESASPPATAAPVTETPDPHRRHKVRVTTELEQIVAKIWATVGEQLKAGHANGGKAPRAKETLAILEQISSSTPAPSSPSISLSSFSATAPAATASAQPSAQQILTAHMLLTLLSSPPTYSMPFGRIKEALSEKLASIGVRASAVGGAGITRPVYGCVAKRLLKFERGGREQVVKFDV